MNKVEQLTCRPDEKVHDNHYIWRYLPLKTLLFHLDGRVFIPSIAKLKSMDPFEGVFLQDTPWSIPWYTKAFRETFGQASSQIETWIDSTLCSQAQRDQIASNSGLGDDPVRIRADRLFEFIRKTRYAWCWFYSPRESWAMWSIYAKQGVAIRSSTAKLKALLEQTGRDFRYRRMRYFDRCNGSLRIFDPEDEFDSDLLLRPFFLKRSEYIAEEEVRFVTCGPVQENLDGLILENCDPQVWIDEVRLWPGLSSSEAKPLIRFVKERLPEVPCDRSDLMQVETDFLRIMESVHQREAQQWVNQGDGIPPELKYV